MRLQGSYTRVVQFVYLSLLSHHFTPSRPITCLLCRLHLDILTVHVDWLLSPFSTALSWWFSHTTLWIFIKACGWTGGFTVMQVKRYDAGETYIVCSTVCEFSWRGRFSVHFTLTFTHCWMCSPATGNAESLLDWYFCDWSGWYLWP